MLQPTIRLYQIYYDGPSLASIESPFIPLDNREGRSDWFEFWPILQFLRDNTLEDDVWYGFVSPKFTEKSGATYNDVQELIGANPDADVALFTYNWAALAFSLNPWVHGEVHHPGLLACSEAFIKTLEFDVSLEHVVTDFETAVFSNYVVAKSSYWRFWQSLAEEYFSFAETQPADSPHLASTQYRGDNNCQMKVFVQERLSAWVLLKSEFRVVHPDYLRTWPRRTSVSLVEQSLSRRVVRWLGLQNLRLRICVWSKRLARRSGRRAPLVIYRILSKSLETAMN